MLVEPIGSTAFLLALTPEARSGIGSIFDVMDAGEIAEDGPSAELRKGTGRFATLHAAWLDSLV